MKRISPVVLALILTFFNANILKTYGNVQNPSTSQNPARERENALSAQNSHTNPNNSIIQDQNNNSEFSQSIEERKFRERLREALRQMNEVNQNNRQERQTEQKITKPIIIQNVEQPNRNAGEETNNNQNLTYDTPFNKNENSIKPAINSIVELFVQYYTTIGRKYLESAFELMQKYYPIIEKMLKEHNLPIELAILPIIESSYNEYARSYSGALGLWQLMPLTGKINGCKITPFIDERMDITIATQAAIKFIQHLNTTFKNWDLVLAAYNGGGNYLLQQMRKYRSDNFWEFSKKDGFSQQTMEYVPKFHAVYHIMLNLKKYGFNKMNFSRKPYFETIEVGSKMDLGKISEILDLQPYELKELNPQLLQNITPIDSDKYFLRIPVGFTNKFLTRKNELNKTIVQNSELKQINQKIIVRQGDTIISIAKRYNLTANSIIKLNHLRHPNSLSTGMPLLLPIKISVNQTGEENNGIPAQTPQNIHQARPQIRHAVPPRVTPRRFIPAPRQRSLAVRRVDNTARNNEYKQRRQRFLLMLQNRNRNIIIRYKVKPGDTIYRIARRLNIDQDNIIEANGGTTRLVAGYVLRISR